MTFPPSINLYINAKVCAHSDNHKNTYKKPSYLHYHLKIPWIANEDAFMWLLRYLPINIRIYLLSLTAPSNSR